MIEHPKEKSCDGKVRYFTRRHAKRNVRRLRRLGEFVKPYRCIFCGCWHVGHPPGNSRRSA